MKIQLSICLLLILGCAANSDSIKLSILNKDGVINELSKSTNIKELEEFKDFIENSNFRKVILSQANKDDLIIEQKDEEGYLVLLKIRYEQFVIEEPLNNLDEVIEIMSEYVDKKDRIMDSIAFQ